MIKQNEGPICRLEGIFNYLQPVGWQPPVLCCAQPAQGRGLGGLQGAREGLELPHQFCVSVQPQLLLSLVPRRAAEEQLIIYRNKAKKLSQQRPPQRAPCHPGHQLGS